MQNAENGIIDGGWGHFAEDSASDRCNLSDPKPFLTVEAATPLRQTALRKGAWGTDSLCFRIPGGLFHRQS